ncbi:MAG TPA: zinc ribbon domain-containing protein [Pyrinomonadaceae bacterium]|jgi:hypothetical protein
MFCPKCAAQNVEGASFCRVCGANVSLVPQALTGELPEAQTDDYRSRRRRRRERDIEPSVEKGIMNVFMGIGFIIAALAIMFKFPAGMFWGWTMFIPGFSNLGRGVASIVAARRRESGKLAAPNATAYFPNNRNSGAAPMVSGPNVRSTGELRPPVPSVTEGTTRHLGAEAPTRHFDE